MSFVDAASSSPGTASSTILGDAEAPYALITTAQRSIGTIFPDVTVREVHTDEDTITQHPVETGTPVADHVFANPQLVEISCGFSDSTAAYAGYVQDVYQSFLALKATRQPFSVSTGKRLYDNMLFASISVVTDETSEFALMVVARLQQVIISATDGGSGMTATNQQSPADTGPEVNAGQQSLQLAPTSSGFVGTNNAGFGPVGANGFANAPAPGFGTGF